MEQGKPFIHTKMATNNKVLIDKISHSKKLIEDSFKKYNKTIIGCSFGKDSMVMMDLVMQVANKLGKIVPVFGIFAKTEFQDTRNTRTYFLEKWKFDYYEYTYEQEGTGDKCCGVPKVDATKQAVIGYDAWFSGIRSTEGITRVDFKEVEERGGLVKINPILEFTETDIWRYTALYEIPVNPKYKEGYRSLGCQFCSALPEDDLEPERAGRWKGTDKEGKECGIHTCSLR